MLYILGIEQTFVDNKEKVFAKNNFIQRGDSPIVTLSHFNVIKLCVKNSESRIKKLGHKNNHYH